MLTNRLQDLDHRLEDNVQAIIRHYAKDHPSVPSWAHLTLVFKTYYHLNNVVVTKRHVLTALKGFMTQHASRP